MRNLGGDPGDADRYANGDFGPEDAALDEAQRLGGALCKTCGDIYAAEIGHACAFAEIPARVSPLRIIGSMDDVLLRRSGDEFEIQQGAERIAMDRGMALSLGALLLKLASPSRR